MEPCGTLPWRQLFTSSSLSKSSTTATPINGRCENGLCECGSLSVTEHLADWTHYTEALVALWPAKAAIAVVATWLATEPVLLYWLAIMWGADWAFGLFEAFWRGKFSCRLVKRGMVKFPAYCVYIILVAAVDACIEVAFHVSVPLLEAFLSYLVAQEGVSVAGHMIRLGLPVPPMVRRILVHGKRKVEKQIDNILDGDDEKKD